MKALDNTKNESHNGIEKNHQKIGQMDALETKSAFKIDKISGKKIWIPIAIAFIILCLLSLLNEIIDLPHLLFKSQPTPVNWQESVIEIVEITIIGIPTILILIHIISARKQAEMELMASEKQYHEAYNRAQFYKDLLSHDIANILQILFSATEVVFINPDNKEIINKELKLIQEQIKRASKLISTVIKLSKIQKAKPQIKPIEVQTTLLKTINNIHANFPGRNIDIQVDLPSEETFIQANSLLIEVFDNILYNAIKYNENTVPSISIRLSKIQKAAHKYVKLEFIDNGIGIPNDRKEQIFQRVYEERMSVSGSGLGLSLVNTIINSYDGQIWVEDRVLGDYNKGSNFVIIIPEAE